MSAYSGNHIHIIESNSERDFVNPPVVLTPPDVRQAQFILNDDSHSVSAEAWKNLCMRLYKDALQSWSQRSSFLANATKTVIDWRTSTTEVDSFAEIKRVGQMNKLLKLEPWKRALVSQILKKDQTAKVYLFKNFGLDSIWALVKEPSTEVIFDYSCVYTKFLEQYPDVYCEFLVFGENELERHLFPDDLITFNKE